MTAAPFIRATAAEQATALAAGEVSSRELTRAHLERIEAVDGALGGRQIGRASCRERV